MLALPFCRIVSAILVNAVFPIKFSPTHTECYLERLGLFILYSGHCNIELVSSKSQRISVNSKKPFFFLEKGELNVN